MKTGGAMMVDSQSVYMLFQMADGSLVEISGKVLEGEFREELDYQDIGYDKYQDYIKTGSRMSVDVKVLVDPDGLRVTQFEGGGG